MDNLITLSCVERYELESACQAGTDYRIYQRARAILLIDEGYSVNEVAEILGISR